MGAVCLPAARAVSETRRDAYPPVAISQWYASGLDASPDDEKQRIRPQSDPSTVFDSRHAFTIVGTWAAAGRGRRRRTRRASRRGGAGRRRTSPSMVTRACSTNFGKSRSVGEPWKRATAAPLRSAAYSSQGPIIQPRLVGQHTTSRSRMSWWAKASEPQRIGVT